MFNFIFSLPLKIGLTKVILKPIVYCFIQSENFAEKKK